jgi:hypothetical protein
LDVSGGADLECWGLFGTDSTLVGAVNDVGDIAADETVVSITYDGFTGTQLNAGDIILIGTELMLVSSATTTVATVVRAIMGTTVAIHLDNAVFTVQENIRILRLTEFVDWASDDAQVTVGNTRSGAADAKKGRVKNVSTGTDADVQTTFTNVDLSTFTSNTVKVNAT